MKRCFKKSKHISRQQHGWARKSRHSWIIEIADWNTTVNSSLQNNKNNKVTIPASTSTYKYDKIPLLMIQRGVNHCCEISYTFTRSPIVSSKISEKSYCLKRNLIRFYREWFTSLLLGNSDNFTLTYYVFQL